MSFVAGTMYSISSIMIVENGCFTVIMVLCEC